jgi:hypothetical protein
MATKKKDIDNLIDDSMKGRNIAASVPTSNAPAKPLERFKPPVKRQIQIRFDPGDYEILQRIAYRKGTSAAALVREAVKEIIKREKNLVQNI